MIAIVNYGMGNVASVSMAFQSLGYEVCITDQRDTLQKASHIILPGVGSFQAAVEEIEKRGLRETLRELAQEKPFLGICLGMQLLFSEGDEGGISKGLDVIPGRVEKMKTNLLLPHIGWNTLNITNNKDEFGVFQDKHVYFVHSYQVFTEPKYIVASTDYEVDVPAIVRNGHIVGMQFHPEKSSDIGMQLLKTFLTSTNKSFSCLK